MSTLTYSYKNKNYEVVTVMKAKLPLLNLFGLRLFYRWKNVVIYHCLYQNLEGEYWSRELDKFMKLFKPIETVNENGTVPQSTTGDQRKGNVETTSPVRDARQSLAIWDTAAF